MSLALFLLANAATELGRSPLVDAGQEHAWVHVIADPEGDGWMDDAWRRSERLEGREIKLVLFRGLPKNDQIPRMDMIMAVDCARNLIGIKGTYLHPPAKGGIPVKQLADVVMDFANDPPAPQDMAIIDFACKAGEHRS